MNLKGTPVRIIITAPREWNNGNLFGTVISERDGKRLVVRLSKSIGGRSFSSDLLELNPQREEDSFKPLMQYYSVAVEGKLVGKDSSDAGELVTGSIAID